MKTLSLVIAGMMAGLLGLSAFISPQQQAAQAQESTQPAVNAPRLIMMPFSNRLRDQDPTIAQTALDHFQTELLSSASGLGFRVLDQRQVNATLQQLGFTQQSVADSAQALELGRRLDADLLLSGSVTVGKIHTSEVTRRQPTEYTWASIQVHVTVTDLKTGEVLFSSQATGQSEKYPTWKSERFTSLIREAVAVASHELSEQLIRSRVSEKGGRL